MIRHSRTYVAAPPGFTVKEMIDDRGISEEQLEERLEKDEAFVRDLIEGDVVLSEDVAGKLEAVLGMRASFWLNLERIYREALVKVAEENAQEAQRKAKKGKRKAVNGIRSVLAASG